MFERCIVAFQDTKKARELNFKSFYFFVTRKTRAWKLHTSELTTTSENIEVADVAFFFRTLFRKSGCIEGNISCSILQCAV